MESNILFILSRKLLFSGFGAEKNRLIVKSFFRKRPTYICSKVRLAYKYIITILLSNLYYIQHMYLLEASKVAVRPDTVGYIPHTESLMNKKILTVSLFSSFFSNCLTPSSMNTMHSTFQVLHSSIGDILSCFQEQLRSIFYFKFFFYIKVVLLHLLRVHFFWKVGFGRPKGRTSLVTLNRSPHTDKRSRSQFSRKTYKAVLKCPFYLLCSKLLFIKRFLNLEAYSTIETISVVNR